MREAREPTAVPVLLPGVPLTPGGSLVLLTPAVLLMLGLLLVPGLPALAQQPPAVDDGPSYILGTNDQILIRVPQAKEIDNHQFRIDGSGNINLPRVGQIHVAGMNLQELETHLVKRLRESVGEPQVVVTVAQIGSPPVFFVGLFVKPGAARSSRIRAAARSSAKRANQGGKYGNWGRGPYRGAGAKKHSARSRETKSVRFRGRLGQSNVRPEVDGGVPFGGGEGGSPS